LSPKPFIMPTDCEPWPGKKNASFCVIFLKPKI
jgi:hypothetical protein